MELLEKAQVLLNSLEGCTSSSVVSTAMSELQDILLEQKDRVRTAHKVVTEARDAEEEEKITYKRIDALLDKAKRQRQELRDEKYTMNL